MIEIKGLSKKFKDVKAVDDYRGWYNYLEHKDLYNFNSNICRFINLHILLNDKDSIGC